MSHQRNATIDFMRGLAIVLMILIHVTAHFLGDRTASWIWDYTHFAVPLFIFCSAYIFFSHSQKNLSISYVFSRIKRLVVPYYVFLAIYLSYIFIIKQDTVPLKDILGRVLFLNMQSADLEWLVVLFLSFILLLPFIRAISQRKILLVLFGILSIGSAVYFLVSNSPIPFRFIMWVPWSFYLLMVYFLHKYEREKWFIPIIILLSGVVFFLSQSYLVAQGHSLTLTHNKYPPNMYYLSYGVLWTYLIYALHRRMGLPGFIERAFSFLSTYSYPIFFIHFLIIYIFLDFVDFRRLQWWGFFIVVTILTVITQIGLNTISRKITAVRH